MKRTKLTAAISMILLGVANQGVAQETQTEESEAKARSIEVIQVTSTKRSQAIGDVPIAISAINEGDIERIGADSVRDMQYSVPNLVVTGYLESQPTFGIRGIADRSRNAGYDNRVGVYVDGVWVGRSEAANQSALDVERVEVLRGPQGTLFGKNTVAGAVNIITKKANSDDVEGRVGVDIGNYGLMSYRGSINLPLTDDLSSRITLSKSDRDHFVDNSDPLGIIPAEKFVKGFNDRDEFASRAQFYWDVSEDTKIAMSADYVYNKGNVLVGEKTDDPLAPKPNKVSIDSLQDMKSKIRGTSLTIDHDLGNDFQLTAISGLRASDWKLLDSDEDYSPLPYATTTQTLQSSHHFSQEIRLASPIYDAFDYIVGVYYLDQSIEGKGTATAFAPAINPLAPPIYVGVSQQADVDTDSYAVFATGNYRFNDEWSLTAGIRYTDETKKIDYEIVDNTGLFTNFAAKDKHSASDFSPTVSLNWKVDEDSLLFSRYSRGFKSGGYNADYINSPEALKFDDESVDSYELGYKTTMLDSTLNMNLTAFYSKHDDFQVQSFAILPSGGTALTITNAAEAKSKGFEVELQWYPTDELQVWFNYGYTDATFDSFPDPVGPGTDFSGNRLADAPKYTYSLGLDYRYPVSAGEIVAQANYFKRDEFYSNPDNAPANLNESLDETSARLGFKSDSDKWDVFLWVKNVADDTVQIHNTVSFLGVPRASYNQPRTYGIKANYYF